MALTNLQIAMAKIYARLIYRGERTLDTIYPQTEEYRNYVRYIYNDLYPNDQI